jgi:hypothetical protein
MIDARKKFLAGVLRTAAELVEDGVITEFEIIERPDGGGRKLMTITLQTGHLLAGRWPTDEFPSLDPARADAGEPARGFRMLNAPARAESLLPARPHRQGCQCVECDTGEA